MPDENKLRKMRKQGVVPVDTCATCKWYQGESRDNWGYCAKATYQHKKHTDSLKSMPTHETFVCPLHERKALSFAAIAQGEYYDLLREGGEGG